MKIRSSSYLDDIELVVSSESIEENCLLLKNAAEKLCNSARYGVPLAKVLSNAAQHSMKARGLLTSQAQ